MKIRPLLALVLLLAPTGRAQAPAPRESGVPGQGPVGHWQGTLRASPTAALRLALDVSRAGDGTLGATLRSLDQGGASIPVKAEESAGSLRLGVPAIQAGFEGTLNANGSELSGQWTQRGKSLPLVFLRQAAAARIRRPQEPVPPLPYLEHVVSIPTPREGVTLAGTLTVPHGDGPYPAVVLVSGSGPQDRDETIAGHRPFLVLADHLTRRGIAVLRCDDRGTGKSTGDFASATHLDFVDDTLAAVAWLKGRPAIDPRKIGLVGHSEGGLVAPLAAVRQPEDISCLVLLAGVGVPMTQLLARQGADLGLALKIPEADLAASAAAQLEIFRQVRLAGDGREAELRARLAVEKHMASLDPDRRKALGLTDGFVESQVKMAASPWFRALLDHDPRAVLRKVACPVLALNGSKDLQVSPRENLEAIRQALAEGGNRSVTARELPGLNHLFQTCVIGDAAEYARIEETFAPQALKAVSDWLRERAGLWNVE